VLGRSYPPGSVRTAAWYLACVSLLAAPVYFLLTSTTLDPGVDVFATAELDLLIPAGIGLFATAGLLYMGFRFAYPVVMVAMVGFVAQALLAPERELLQVLVPAPALLLLLTPSALSWFFGLTRHVGVAEREFHLPHR
jgi:hypothetical protein